MENGFVRLPRTLFKSDAWSVSRTYSTFESYLDLFQMAQWRPFQYYVNGNYIHLEPGELVTTSVRLAQRWHWRREEVRRWLRHLRDHRVLTFAVVENMLKISLDSCCHAHWCQTPSESPRIAGGEGGVHSLHSSSENENEKTSSVSPSSFSPKEEKNEERKDEESMIHSSEEKKNEEMKSSARASADELADRIARTVSGSVRPRYTANDFTENSQRLAELREHCSEPLNGRTEFPPDFPMEEFRAYVDAAMKNTDRRLRPELGRGWLAALRDRFLAEREAAATPSSQPDHKQAA